MTDKEIGQMILALSNTIVLACLQMTRVAPQDNQAVIIAAALRFVTKELEKEVPEMGALIRHAICGGEAPR